MKEFTQNEYNFMCAEFLGWEYKSQESIHFPKGTYRDLRNVGHCAQKGLSFDSDWNRIMMIVEKIENTYGVSIIGSPITSHTCSIFLGNNESVVVEKDTKKEAVVQAIWEFLNWYKENEQ